MPEGIPEKLSPWDGLGLRSPKTYGNSRLASTDCGQRPASTVQMLR